MILYEEDIERLVKIRDFIHDNLCYELKTSIVAKKFGIDKYKLRRHFTKHFKHAFYHYIFVQRMKKAMDLLCHKTPVFETAKAVGYDDKSAFSHAFTGFFGESPASILKRHEDE